MAKYKYDFLAHVLNGQLHGSVIYKADIACRSGYFLTQAGGGIDTIMVPTSSMTYGRAYPRWRR